MYLKSTFTLCLALLCNVAAARDIHVSATQGNDSNPGTAQQPYRTVSKAAAEAMPGDIITVHEGTYRELVRPQRSGTKDRPIVYQAAPGEQVVITGSEPAKGWVRVDKDTWKLVIDNTFAGEQPL